MSEPSVRTTPSDHGMKLVQVWVRDPAAPGFGAEAESQARPLRGAPEERDALEFIEDVADRGDPAA